MEGVFDLAQDKDGLDLDATQQESQDSDVECQEYDDAQLTAKKPVSITESVNHDGTIKKIFKASKSTLVSQLIYLNGARFDFTGRDYLKPIYNRNDKNIMLKTARQVEKCVASDTFIVLTSGAFKTAATIVAGDEIWGYNAGQKVPTLVVASEDNGNKECVKLTTKSGQQINTTLNHPIWCRPGQWVEAGCLTTVDEVGFFTDDAFSWEGLDAVKFIGVRSTWAIQTDNGSLVVAGIVTYTSNL